ncbi:MAG: tetratricopeptide repeat protein [Acidimicrobiia bacterium]
MTTYSQNDQRVALNADVVGYSRLMADDHEATSRAMTDLRVIVESEITSHGGVLANFVGDNFMAIFDEPKTALQASIAISTDVEDRNTTHGVTNPVRFRMGIDLGSVASAHGDFEGEALNIASRIQSEAMPGGVSVSGRVYRALDEPALRFRGTGEHRLKNIPEPVEIFQFVGLPTDASVEGQPGVLSLEAPTIAVLPIHTESADDDVTALAGIIRGDLVHRLSTNREIVLVDVERGPDGGNSEVPARYMVETGVYQYGTHLRVFATLFDVTTMNVVKSHKWASTADAVLELSEEIAEDVARSIEIELVVGVPAGLYAELGDPQAIEHVYLGWYFLRSDTREGWVTALEHFEAVAQSHPDQPFGHVLSGYANWIGVANGWVSDPLETLELAREQAHRGGLAGDPTGMAKAVDAAALMSLGRIDEAVESMDQVEQIRPTCDVTYALEGSLRRYLGQWEEAVDLLDVAMRLTGINKPWYPTVKACSLYIGNRLEQAAAVAEGVLEYQPNNLEALLVLASAQHELGLERRAQATADEVRKRFPSTDVAAWLERSPYQDDEIIARWSEALSDLGLI